MTGDLANGMILVNVHIHVVILEQKHKKGNVIAHHQQMVEKIVKINQPLVQTSVLWRVTETFIVQVRVKTLIDSLYFTNKPIVRTFFGFPISFHLFDS